MTFTARKTSSLAGAGINFTTLAPEPVEESWAFNFTDSANNLAGNFSGQVAEKMVTLTLNVIQPATVACTGELTATAVQDLLTGDYSFLGCWNAMGTFSLTRP